MYTVSVINANTRELRYWCNVPMDVRTFFIYIYIDCYAYVLPSSAACLSFIYRVWCGIGGDDDDDASITMCYVLQYMRLTIPLLLHESINQCRDRWLALLKC
jgi:hypothetical protein